MKIKIEIEVEPLVSEEEIKDALYYLLDNMIEIDLIDDDYISGNTSLKIEVE